MFLSDAHIPYESKAYELFLDIYKEEQPDELILLGDFADFYGVSRYEKNVKLATLKDERQVVCKRLKELYKLSPKTKKIFIEGNHEHRLFKFLQRNAPELVDLVNLDEFLCLDEYKYEFVPYTPNQSYHPLGIKDLVARHEPLSGGENFAKLSLKKGSSSIIFGHHHQIQRAAMTSLDGRDMEAHSVGGMMDKTHEVFQYTKGPQQWQLSFGTLRLLSNGVWFFNNNQIKQYNNKFYCIYGGYLYEE